MTQPAAVASVGDDRNPWRPLSLPAERPEAGDDEAVGKRAFCAAVIGLVVPFTLLSFYSLYLLAAYPPTDRQSDIWGRPAAWLINAATVAVVFTYFSMFVR